MIKSVLYSLYFIFIISLKANHGLCKGSERTIGGNYLVCLSHSPYYNSKLCDILVLLLFQAKQRKHYGNAVIYRHVIDSFEKMYEDGLVVDVVTVRPVLMILHGDNKSINEYTG